MGWDVKATVDAATDALSRAPELPSTSSVMDRLTTLPDALPKSVWGLIAISAMTFAFFGMTDIGRRIRRGVQEAMFSNWRLALLGATGIVLSLASGYTTWDGMRNFTGEPVLSLMITFGIQGVMLIIAWLIGETFATGMSQQTASYQGGFARGTQASVGAFLGALLFIALMVLMLQSTGRFDLKSAATGTLDWSGLADSLLIIVVGLLAAALMALYSASDLVKPYVQSSRVIVKNAVLWVMFLSCMATSVFFSFDSLFTAIFPQSERVRAAELRAQNQVAGIIADIGGTIETRRMTAVEELFGSEGWNAYDATLAKLAKEAQASAPEIETYFNEQIENKNRAIKEQQERIATSQSGQAGLAVKKTTLTDELARLEGERPTLAEEYAKAKGELDSRAKEIDGKRVDAMAEDKGVEGTGNVGKGPVWRQRMAELGKLKDYYKVGEERVNDAKKRLDATETRIGQVKRELAAVDGDLAKYKGEEETAGERIKLTQEALAGEKEQTRIDPARVLPAFENARSEFRQDPTLERLSNVQKQCSQIYNAMFSAEVTKPRVRDLDCDPKSGSEAAAVLFALNAGSMMFNKNCAGGDKLAQHTTADALFGFSRKCLADSGLPSKETDALRTRINFIELNRDDKAHRFVVTWNAFEDGNRLAYLALAVAVAIDLLIFMSGLFGANAVRSPLSDVPSFKARTGQQLEDIIENALLPDTFDNARSTLHAMRPITNASGFMAEVRPDRLDPHTAERVLGVLNAGATIHAVEFDELRGRYLVRAELFEFLSVVAKKAFEASDSHASNAELEKIVGVALLPDIGPNAETVLSYMHPISEDRGFTAEIRLGEVDQSHVRTVRSVLNAGATHDRVQRVGTDAAHYYVHKDLYRTLARIRGRTLFSGTYGQPQLASHGAREGASYRGSLMGSQSALPDHSSRAGQPFDPDEITEDYWRRLIEAAGFNVSTINRILSNELVPEAANDVWYALSNHSQHNSELKVLIADTQRRLNDRVERAFSALHGQANADVRKIEILERARQQVDEFNSVFMMLPEMGLVSRLIEQLELAASPDNGQRPGEQEFKESLNQVQSLLKRLDLADVEAWRKIETVLLEPVDEEVPQFMRGQQNGDSKGRLN